MWESSEELSFKNMKTIKEIIEFVEVSLLVLLGSIGLAAMITSPIWVPALIIILAIKLF